jgi:hypothetical protein
MSITTKTGDDGYTDIIGGKRLSKDHPVMECLGAVDELNAFLGEAKAALAAGMPTAKIITEIQKSLFSLMGVIAGMPVPLPTTCYLLSEPVLSNHGGEKNRKSKKKIIGAGARSCGLVDIGLYCPGLVDFHAVAVC